jgi:hypothetical protein
MGKASSNKKVARAAGIGGGHSRRRQTPWTYFGVIALIVILGIAATVSSRERRLTQINTAGGTPPTVGTVWNMGYAVYECGKFAPAISSKNNPEGIHTDDPGNGIIHIAPTTKSAAGKNATLGKFADAVGMKLNAAELQIPGGKLWLDGDTCEGKPGHVYVMHFAYIGATGQLYNGHTTATPGRPAQLPKIDPRDVPLADQELVTIAFVPADKAGSIPAPPEYVNKNLSALGANGTTTTTTPASTTTVPATTSTTVKK